MKISQPIHNTYSYACLYNFVVKTNYIYCKLFRKHDCTLSHNISKDLITAFICFIQKTHKQLEMANVNGFISGRRCSNFLDLFCKGCTELKSGLTKQTFLYFRKQFQHMSNGRNRIPRRKKTPQSK